MRTHSQRVPQRTPAKSTPSMGVGSSLWRGVVRLVLVMLTTGAMGFVFLLQALLGRVTPSFVKRYSELWGRRIQRWTGMAVTYDWGGHAGGLPEGCILIANHRSYADIPAIVAAAPATFLAKREVASWPVIGWAAQVAGTVFVDRSDKESRGQARLDLQSRVAEGISVMVFAEGTTVPQGELLPLRPGMFHVAAAQQLPIVPVAIEYQEAEDAWTGDDTFVAHFLRRFGRPSTHVKVCFGPVLRGNDALQLHAQTESWMASRLGINAVDAREQRVGPMASLPASAVPEVQTSA